jgi:hypothetical protein
MQTNVQTFMEFVTRGSGWDGGEGEIFEVEILQEYTSELKVLFKIGQKKVTLRRVLHVFR